MRPPSSDFSVVRVTDEVVFLKDDDLGRMSVTNDAEQVVYAVAHRYPGRRIIYRDSIGEWSELHHDAGTFLSFGMPCSGPPD